MFHVKPTDPEETRALESAPSVFGARLPLAERYRDLLATDGVDHGLIGPREVDRLWSRHIMNSAVIAERIAEGAVVTDIGSGAGLPGLPLAIARPDLIMTLVEPLERRADFLRRFVDAAGLSVAVVRGRAEEPATIEAGGMADVVTSRAVASIDKLARWSTPLIRVGGKMMPIKGASASDELAKHSKALAKAGLSDPQVLSCGVGLLETPTTVVELTRTRR
ncbi:16S rRNA (guanine(527)-N(7))-methyltransferase RsmG [Jongsikchunia kroppenstedtii]|uniref:16S rRNA (guanine(527)-N(7))-methyltransferase RsmG n=1 Tax=Jongsikchunia kroppenstedtii TaxID=1121721 RepID=UPI0003A56D8F|nr:16S rRNA (guanine(527)-N(7))-methyltransferase RsmG [Jongsikchunia kroppenstedtii]